MRVSLTVIEGPHQGRSFEFDQHETFIVGRSPKAHFRLPAKDKYFSRNHFMAEINPPFCRLMDLGSTNGTFVNGRKVTQADLQDGDLIKGGVTTVRVSITDRDDSAIQTRLESVLDLPTLAPVNDSGLTRPIRSSQGSGEVCLGCGSSFARTGQPSESLLCVVCQDQSREHPQPIAGYRILRELGRGGMGVVRLALRLADGALIALKTIIPAAAGSPTRVAKFLREASILRELDHPNIVSFGESGESNGQLFFAMDFVRGQDAARLLKTNGGPLPIPLAVSLTCQLLEALEYAHAKGFVHRDIKPANLLVTEENGREIAKLADFGLARVYQASCLSGLSMIGDVGGTIAFMAPEQVVDFRGTRPAADQYSVAATLYNLLTDRYVYDLPQLSPHQIRMILQDDPIPIQSRRSNLPTGLAQAIQRGLAREPEKRFRDVAEMRRTLAKFAGAT